jgi:hypothetical protein
VAVATPLDRRLRRQRYALAAVLVLVAAVVAFVAVTAWTGFPGPGALRRYPTTELDALVHKIDERPQSGNLYAPAAHVDWIQSRVVLPYGCVDRSILTRSEVAMIENPNRICEPTTESP